MTVSRFLRKPEQVSEALGKRIAEAVEQLGYIPNRVPDILSNSTSRAIGVLLPSLTNQVFAEVIRGIEHITDRNGYQTMLAHYGYSAQKEEERLLSLLSYNIDGLILAERTHTPKTLKVLQTTGIPVVELMDSISPCIDIAVGIDNFEAARQMTMAMIERGHKQVVYLGARQDERTLIRLQGFEAAMRSSGLRPRKIMTPSSSSYSLGAQLLQETRQKYPDVDGLFCTNDDIAIGAIFECQRQGINVPEDIAVAGFHGHNIGQVMTPKLASILTPRDVMGRRAAESLLSRMKGEKLQQTMIDVGFTLSLGESV